jgi:phage shock protein PspC (stress-responsive transcriptional regulator)
VTDDIQQPPATLPPDPEKYDEYRNVAARKRGLEQPYIVGGEDPGIDEELARERPYVRLLVAMVVVIVLMGFGLGIIGYAITGS